MECGKEDVIKYPDIILSDCSIANIQVKEDEIIVSFDEYGFFKKDREKDIYYRTEGSQIVFKEVDMANISIEEIRVHKISSEVYFKSICDIDFGDFLRKVATREWDIEIVEEFYSSRRALYIVRVRANEERFLCHIKLQYEKLLYLWNSIRYDCPF